MHGRASRRRDLSHVTYFVDEDTATWARRRCSSHAPPSARQQPWCCGAPRSGRAAPCSRGKGAKTRGASSRPPFVWVGAAVLSAKSSPASLKRRHGRACVGLHAAAGPALFALSLARENPAVPWDSRRVFPPWRHPANALAGAGSPRPPGTCHAGLEFVGVSTAKPFSRKSLRCAVWKACVDLAYRRAGTPFQQITESPKRALLGRERVRAWHSPALNNREVKTQ